MKKIKSLICYLMIILILTGCARETYKVQEPTSTTPDPTAGLGVPVISTAEFSPEAGENPQPPACDWEALYTEDNPVTDPQELIRILEDLNKRFLNQFDKQGWYRLSFFDYITHWIHVSDPGSGKFDGTMNFYTHEMYDGFIWHAAFLSLDGHYGRTIKNAAMDDFSFYTLDSQPPEPTWGNLGYFLACDHCMGHLLLKEYIDWIRDPDNAITPKSEKKTEFQGWVETFENQPVFTLRIQVNFLTNLPTTETGERVQTEEIITHFSLVNGGAISETTSGNADMDDTLPFNLHLIAWFEELPKQEQAIYDEAARKLIEFDGSK
jgi:hypothetical protein